MARLLVLTLSFLFILVPAVFGEAMLLSSYQGLLADAEGKPIDGTVAMEFTIYNDSTAGDILWNESHPVVTVNSGLFCVNLSFAGQPVAFNEIESAFLGIQVDGNPEIDPRVRLAATTWSLRVASLEGAVGGNVRGDLQVAGNMTIGPSNVNSGKDAFVVGTSNYTIHDNTSITGGSQNTTGAEYAIVTGGYGNLAGGQFSVIGGGKNNNAGGEYATIPGGIFNIANGLYSVAMGNRANAMHDGTIVLSAHACET